MDDNDATSLTWDALGTALPGFDLDQVRSLIGANTALYLDLLRQFHDEYREEAINITFLLGMDRCYEAEKQLHKMKGVAGNLGATALNQAAEHLDTELKQGRYSEKCFDAWQTRFLDTLASIGQLLARHRASGRTARSESGDQQFRTMLHTLEDQLARNAMVDTYLLQAMQPHIQPPELQLYGRLVKFIAQRDLPKARSTLGTLIYLANAIA